MQLAVDIRGNGIQAAEEDDGEQGQPLEDEEEMPMQFRGGPDRFRVSKEAIEKYGPIEGCPARSSTQTRGLGHKPQ